MTEPIERCESCGLWVFVYPLDKLMGRPHFCSTCRERQKGNKRAA
jgi:hypothetical protein